MKIELPSPRKPAPVTPKQGSLYHEMGKTSLSDEGTVDMVSYSAIGNIKKKQGKKALCLQSM